jgi:ribosomal protein S18 acetylase RimI-like enzyme
MNRIDGVQSWLEYTTKPGGVCEILDIYVHETQRRKGLGTKLIEKLRQDVTEQVHVVTRRSNGVARLFYQSLGWFEVVLPGYYPGEDGVMFIDRVRP